MIGKEKLSTDLLAELYDTYRDVKSGKLTLTRIYILVIICGLVSFSVLCVSMLFAMQFTIALVYFLCSAFCYCLLRFRRHPKIARFFDWIAVIASHLLSVITISINVYLYGNAGGSELLLFAMVTILYIITLDKTKKRFFITSLIFAFDLVAFVAISYLDAQLPDGANKSETFYYATYIVAAVLATGICIAPVWISGLFSVEDVEHLTALEVRQETDIHSDEFYGCLSRKGLDLLVSSSEGENYKNLNICVLEAVIGLKRSDMVFKVNDFYFARVLKEFATLLGCYFANARFLIRWDTNTFLVIFEQDYERSYKILSKLISVFERKISAENDSLEVCLRISAKHYFELDTKKRPRLLLDRINELIRIKHNNRVLGREFLQFSCELAKKGQS